MDIFTIVELILEPSFNKSPKLLFTSLISNWFILTSIFESLVGLFTLFIILNILFLDVSSSELLIKEDPKRFSLLFKVEFLLVNTEFFFSPIDCKK